MKQSNILGDGRAPDIVAREDNEGIEEKNKMRAIPDKFFGAEGEYATILQAVLNHRGKAVLSYLDWLSSSFAGEQAARPMTGSNQKVVDTVAETLAQL